MIGGQAHLHVVPVVASYSSLGIGLLERETGLVVDLLGILEPFIIKKTQKLWEILS